MPRPKITKEMIECARDSGWTISEASRYLKRHRSSITAACDRFGIELGRSKFNPDMPSTRSRFWKDVVEAHVENKPVKLSASKSAINRALLEIDAKKRLQAQL